MGALPDKNMLSRHDGVRKRLARSLPLRNRRSRKACFTPAPTMAICKSRAIGNRTWKNITDEIPGVPKNTYVSRIVPSRYAEGTAYLTFDGHRADDYSTYVFVTNEYGESWKSIKSNLPAGVTARVIREHPRNQNLLFLGTEFGAYVSFDRGARWTRLQGNFPMVRVDDIQIHPRDNAMVLATHGRSIWVLDDLSPLERAADSILASDIHLFDVAPATHFRLYNRKGNIGHKWFTAPNPPYGAVINYYLKDKPKDDVKITITNSAGTVVRDLKGPKEAGLSRVVWDLRLNSPAPPPEGAAGAGGGGGFFGQSRGPRVPPGTYTIKIAAGDKTASGNVVVQEDPRIQIVEADRGKLNEAITRVYALQKSADAARKTMRSLNTQITALQTSLKDNSGSFETNERRDSEVVGPVGPDSEETGCSRLTLAAPGPLFPTNRARCLAQINGVAGGLDSYTAAPTADEMVRIDDLAKQLNDLIAELNKFVETDVANLNKQLRDSGLQFLNPGKRIEPPQ